jgi:hypothetical protein
MALIRQPDRPLNVVSSRIDRFSTGEDLVRGMLYIRLLPVLAGAMVIQQAFAQTLPASVIACADETDVLKRLSCYDREIARYRNPSPAASVRKESTPNPASATPATTLSPPSAAAGPATPTAAPASPEATAAADFGMNGELKRKEGGATPQPARPDKLTARVASITNRPTGQAIYTLEGGQVWMEAETESHLPLHPGEEVTIKRGVLGAFYLSSAEVRGLRVKRVR